MRRGFGGALPAVLQAKDGRGVILESTTLAFEELRSGQLVPFSREFEVIEFPGYWLVCPARHMGRRSVRLFSEWVESVGARDAALARDWLAARGHRFRLERRAGFGDADTAQDET